MATECIPDQLEFEGVKRRRVIAVFDGGRMTSDAGALLLRRADRAIGLIDRVAGCFHDGRAQEGVEMGLCNVVVPHDQLDAKVDKWCQEILERSPTSLAIAKRSFNADTEDIRGIGSLGIQALKLYYASDESKEGVNAFLEKRNPEFRKFVT